MTFDIIADSPSLVLSPVVPVNTPKRQLWCERCRMVTLHKRLRRGNMKVYRCDCGEELIHIIVMKVSDEKGKDL